MKHDEIINTLNDLIQTCNDGKEGFMACADNAKIDSPHLKTMLIERSCECASAAEKLGAIVRDLKGVPVTSGTAAGALHRGWLNVKTAITGKTDRAVLEECERGEDVAKAAYQKARAKELPELIRAVVEEQYQNVLKNHDLVKRMRDEANAAHT